MHELIDLAAERLGGAVLYANDEFFAPKENLLKPAAPVFKEHEYTERGKWMDGWETRRRRTPGHDWCLVRLGVPGVLREVVVDTAHFKGNYPEQCSLEGCAVEGHPSVEALLAKDTEWAEALPKSSLQGDTQNRYTIDDPRRFTHLRLNIFPDGGVARLRVYGEAIPAAARLRGFLDLAAIENGAYAPLCSDMFFGNRHNLLMPGTAGSMSDGWETRRRRGPGHDWILIRLAAQGIIERVEVDTTHFQGNAPGSCMLEVSSDEQAWDQILPNTPLEPHTRHDFAPARRPAAWLRFNIYPDGGVARLRAWGRATREGRLAAGVRRLNATFDAAAHAGLLQCCGARAWAARMNAARPFPNFEALAALAADTWRGLRREDWLEAFAAHPRIGQQGAVGSWSSEEQAGAAAAPAALLADLAAMNRAYEARFGYIYIVCAAEKPAQELRDILKSRLQNEPEKELRIAAAEQERIMRRRLENLLT
jgi:allantoicase